jgi:hypothetical protein
MRRDEVFTSAQATGYHGILRTPAVHRPSAHNPEVSSSSRACFLVVPKHRVTAVFTVADGRSR